MSDNLMSPDDWDFIWQNLSEGMGNNPGRDFRFDLITKLIPKSGNLKILDFGCGTGNLLNRLMVSFPNNEYWGADTSAVAVGKTKQITGMENIEVIDLTGPIPTVDCQPDFFDLIICSEVLEHIADVNPTLSLLRALLKPGGEILITVPGGPRSKFDLFIGHKRHYSRSAVFKLLNDHEFESIVVRKSGFPAINMLRFATIILGNRMIVLLKNGKFGSSGASGMIVKFLRFSFRHSFMDSIFGWQLVITANKPSM